MNNSMQEVPLVQEQVDTQNQNNQNEEEETDDVDQLEERAIKLTQNQKNNKQAMVGRRRETRRKNVVP